MRKTEKSLQTQQLTTSPSVRKLRVCWSCLCFTILSKLSQRRSHFHIRGFGTKTAAIWQPADYQTIFRRPLSVILLQHQTEVDSLTDAVTHPAATRRDGTTGCVSTHPRILWLLYFYWTTSTEMFPSHMWEHPHSGLLIKFLSSRLLRPAQHSLTHMWRRVNLWKKRHPWKSFSRSLIILRGKSGSAARRASHQHQSLIWCLMQRATISMAPSNAFIPFPSVCSGATSRPAGFWAA